MDYAQLNYEELKQIEADNYIQMKGNRPTSPENRLLMDLGSVIGSALVSYSGCILLYRVARGHWPNPAMLLLSPAVYLGKEFGKLAGWLENKIEEVVKELFNELIQKIIKWIDPSSACGSKFLKCVGKAGWNPFKEVACYADFALCIL